MAAIQDITVCTIHHGNQIEYYCKSHDKVGCEKCMTEEHDKCDKVNHIDKFIDKLEESADYIHFQDDLNDIRYISKEINDNITEHEEVLERGLSKEKAEIERIRSEMNKMFDNILTHMEEKEEEALGKDMATTDALSHEADHALLDLEKIENQVENMRRSRKFRELFIKLKTAKPELLSIEKRMDKLCSESNLGHNSGRLLLPSIQGEAEIQMIKLEEACVEFKLSVTKTNPDM